MNNKIWGNLCKYCSTVHFVKSDLYEMAFTGPSDSGFLRYTLSTTRPLAFSGGCQRARIDLGTCPLAATNESKWSGSG